MAVTQGTEAPAGRGGKDPDKPKTGTVRPGGESRGPQPRPPKPKPDKPKVSDPKGAPARTETSTPERGKQLGTTTVARAPRQVRRDARTAEIVRETRNEVRTAARAAGASVSEARVVAQKTARQLNERAEKLDPGLLRDAPDLASDLLVSQTRTKDLREASTAVHEAVRQFVAEQRKKAREEWLESSRYFWAGETMNRLESLTGVEMKTDDQIMMELTDKFGWDEIGPHFEQIRNWGEGWNTDDLPLEDIRAYRERVYVLYTNPDIFGAMERDFELAEAWGKLITGEPIDPYEGIAQDREGKAVYTGEAEDFTEALARGIGGSLMAPVTAPAAAVGGAARFVGLDNLADVVGAGLRGAETGIGYGVRAAESSLAAFVTLDPDRFLSWDEHKAGQSPISDLFFDVTGLDPEENKGLGMLVDLAGDLILAEAGIRGGAWAKKINTVPGTTFRGKVRWPGEEFLSKHPAGIRLEGKIWEIIQNTPAGKRKSTLQAWLKDAPKPFIDRIAAQTTRDGVHRSLARYIDDVAEFELPRVMKELEGVDAEILAEESLLRAREITARTPEGPVSPLGGQAKPKKFDLERRTTEEGAMLDAPASADPAYAYRADSIAEFERIVREGRQAAPPRSGETWEDGGIDPRLYFADNARAAAGLAPVRGDLSVVWRWAKPDDAVPSPSGFRGESYSATGRVDPALIEVLDGNGNWVPYNRKPPVGATMDPLAMDALIARRASLWQRARDLEAHRALERFPRPSRMRAWMRGQPSGTRVGRIMDHVFGGIREGGRLDLSKIFDDFNPGDRQITYRRMMDEPDQVIAAVRKEMNVAKVPHEGQVSIIEEFFRIGRSNQRFERWAENLESVLYRGTTRPRRTKGITGQERFLDSDMLETFKFAPRSLEERISSPVSRKYDTTANKSITKVENSLQTPDGQPMLTRPEQFLQGFWLPDMGLLREATSTIKWIDRWAKTQPWIIKDGWATLSASAKAVKTFATVIRHYVRPSILLSPRLWGKIQFDQTLRRFAEGYYNARWLGENVDYSVGGIPIIPKNARTLLKEYGMDETALGSIAEAEQAFAKMARERVETTYIDPNPSNPQAVRVVEARVEQLQNLATSPLVKRFVADGPQKTLAFLEANPRTTLGRWWHEDMKPYLAEHGRTPQDWMIALEEEITAATFNNVALRRGLATGRVGSSSKHMTGSGFETARLTDEIMAARGELARTEAGIPRMELLRRIDELDRRLSKMADDPLDTTTFDVLDNDALRAEIFDLWGKNPKPGTFMPEEVLVNRKVPLFEARPPKNMRERLLHMSSRHSHKLYGGLRLLGKYDLSRKSTFTNAFRQIREAELARYRRASGGAEPPKAMLASIEERAAQRAAYITKDLHYDIAARSSFDNAMKDLFWFSAVYREQITTWGYKIPARSYWPIGAPLRLHETYAVLDTLKAAGILDWEEVTYYDENGKKQTDRNLVMNVPFFTPFIQKVLKNSEAGRLNIMGLNPLTPGTAGVLPTISPAMELVLMSAADRLPEELRPGFEILNKLFTFDGDMSEGPSFMPTAIRDALGFLGVEVPFDQLSGGAWGEAYRRGRVQALKWAMSDLAAEGVLPPKEAEEATAEAVSEVYSELGIAALEAKLTETEKGYLTGKLTELETEGLTDKLSPAEIATLQEYMERAATLRAEYAATAEEGGVEYERYIDQVNARADEFRHNSTIIHLLGSLIFPGRFTDANGVTDAGEAYYAEKERLLAEGYNYEDESIYDPLNAYLRAHPEAYPYSVSTHPGVYGTPTYDNQKTVEPVKYIQDALTQTHYWMDEAEKDPETGKIKVKDTVPEGDKPEVERRYRERDLVNLATIAPVDIAQLKKHDLDALGVDAPPSLLSDFQRAARIFEKNYDSDDDDDDKTRLWNQYNQNLAGLASKHGEQGEDALRWFRATPAEKLRRADYFVTPASERYITEANAMAARQTSDGSGLFSEEDEWARTALYRQIEVQRQENPAFDRELRRAELALGERGAEGRVATYEWLFFGIDYNFFGHIGRIAEGL